jgi:hypothetical protein
MLYEHQINQLLVLDNERLIGLVTATDLSHFVTNATMIDGVSTPSLEPIIDSRTERPSERDRIPVGKCGSEDASHAEISFAIRTSRFTYLEL